MSRYANYDDFDRPPHSTWRRQDAFPSLTAHRHPQRPWSPDNHYDEEEYIGDGGAIARYLETVEQERGVDTAARAGPSTSHWDGRHDSRFHNSAQRNMNFESWRSDDFHEDAHVGSSRRHHGNRRRRQEPSDGSVEALDLADYSSTYARRAQEQLSLPIRPGMIMPPTGMTAHVDASDFNRYPQYASPSRLLPNTADLEDAPIVERPFSAQSRQSRSTAKSGRTSLGPPPSFVSARERLTATPSSQHSHRSSPKSSGRGMRLSEPPRHASSLPLVLDDPESAPDVRTFPKWSRGWYDSASKPSSYPSSPPMAYQEADIGVWPQQAAVGTTTTMDPHSAPRSSDSNFLPWGHSVSQVGHTLQMSDPPQYVPESVKEERMRMLEKEFGGKGKQRAPDPHVLVGSVDESGQLITDGPKMRATVRVMQCILALAGAAAGLYGALTIHPKIPAPPSGTAPAYVLYGFSIFSFLFSCYFFGLRPCLRRRKRRKQDKLTGQMGGAPGMMVLPVMQGLQQKKHKKQKGEKGKKGRGGDEGVQVNLIVDPTLFGGGDGTGRSRRRRDEGSDEDSAASDSSSIRRDKPARPKRKSVFEAMALERDWKAARSRLKWQFAVDIAFMILWGATFFFVLWGKRCPPGGFDGWCNAYNVSSACACLLSVAFGFGIFYDIKDMSASKVSPRTRT